MKFVLEGYLPNYPYHLISDEEMCDAFLTYPDYDFRTPDEVLADVTLSDDEIWDRFLNGDEPCYFKDNYPYISYEDIPDVEGSSLDHYRALVTAIADNLKMLKESLDDSYVLPDWIYSYMLGSVISVNSSQLDKHGMFVMMGVDNDFDEYRYDSARACYCVSKQWLERTDRITKRPPTMFGEPHVIKSLRLQELEVK